MVIRQSTLIFRKHHCLTSTKTVWTIRWDKKKSDFHELRRSLSFFYKFEHFLKAGLIFQENHRMNRDLLTKRKSKSLWVSLFILIKINPFLITTTATSNISGEWFSSSLEMIHSEPKAILANGFLKNCLLGNIIVNE